MRNALIARQFVITRTLVNGTAVQPVVCFILRVQYKTKVGDSK